MLYIDRCAYAPRHPPIRKVPMFQHNVLRTRALELGLRQDDIAREAQVTQPTVSRMFRPDVGVQAGPLLRVVDVINREGGGITLTDLIEQFAETGVRVGE